MTLLQPHLGIRRQKLRILAFLIVQVSTCKGRRRLPSQKKAPLKTHRVSHPTKTSPFIALIHPIQWTIALPVGATGPAKRQKKTSCIYYRQDRSQSVHSPGGASYFISCLLIDVIASFSFGAKECAEDFLQRYAFEVLQRTLPSFLFFISTE